METHKYIPGYEQLYSVSITGEVISHLSGIVLRPGNAKGYLFVRLSKNKTIKPFLVHRLVALAFIENPHNKPQVNHIDFNKHNNAVSNLEWCTGQENKDHYSVYGNGKRLCIGDVLAIRSMRGIVTQRQLSIKYNVGLTTIKNIQGFRSWKNISLNEKK